MTLEFIAMFIAFVLLLAVGYAIYHAEKTRGMEKEYDGPIPDINDPQYWEEDEYGFAMPPGVMWKDVRQEPEHYEIEDAVHVVNPYTGEFLLFEDRECTRPGTYEVFAIVRDPATNHYRYKLAGMEGYYGHDWLIAAEAGPLVISMPEADRQIREIYEEQLEEFFLKREASPEVANAIDAKVVDDLLDRINAAGTLEEKTQLFRALREYREQRGENA